MAASRSAALAAPFASDSPQSRQPRRRHHCLPFPLSSSLGHRFRRNFSIQPRVQGHRETRVCLSPVNEVAVDGSASTTAVAISKIEVKCEEGAPVEVPGLPKEASISAVMADVANLVKLVDSRGIVELELKHLCYELVIRKKEALLQPVSTPFIPSQATAQPPYPVYIPLGEPAPASAPAVPPTSAPVPAAAAAPPATNLPHILSPMAGTFYRSPAPGEPPFVKVGDKVQKGQVICIVEAMKLMNEIEADQSGTIVELLVEDGKPICIDTPLFSIKP